MITFSFIQIERSWAFMKISNKNASLLFVFQSQYMGFDFQKNSDIYTPVFGQYATEIFTKEVENIITNHEPSQVSFIRRL